MSTKFELITGESDETLHVGMHLSCTVTELQEYRANVVVEGGMRGSIHINNVSDDDIQDISQVLSKGMLLKAVVLAINKE